MFFKQFVYVITFIIVILHKFQHSFANVNKESLNIASVPQQLSILLCSDSILNTYEMLQGQKYDEINFNIDLTLANGTESTNHIVEEFQTDILETFCESYINLLKQKDWSLFENGSLYTEFDKRYVAQNEYCFELMEDDVSETFYITPKVCHSVSEKLTLFERINSWVLVVSVLCLLLTISAYCCLPEFRNVHGKCFISYLCCLTISYSILSYVNLTTTVINIYACYILGFMNYFMELCYYSWLCIISYGMWRHFSNTYYETFYVRYIPFGWLVPMLMTCLAYIIEISNIPEELKPGITSEYCGLNVTRRSAVIYLYGPCFLTLLFSLFTFIWSFRHINNHKTDVTFYTDNNKFSSLKSRLILYLRLFVLMGLSWIIDIVSFVLILCNLNNVCLYLEFINGNQGVFIFICFIYRKRVRLIVTERIKNIFCWKRAR